MAIWVAPLVVVGGLVVVALVLFGSVGPTPLERAAEECSVGEDTLEATDSGTRLTVASGDGRTGWEATIMSVCVLTELGAPDTVKSELKNAPSVTSPQSATWDDYVLTWTYGRNPGLEIVVEMGQGAVDDFQRA